MQQPLIWPWKWIDTDIILCVYWFLRQILFLHSLKCLIFTRGAASSPLIITDKQHSYPKQCIIPVLIIEANSCKHISGVERNWFSDQMLQPRNTNLLKGELDVTLTIYCVVGINRVNRVVVISLLKGHISTRASCLQHVCGPDCFVVLHTQKLKWSNSGESSFF